MEHKYDGAMFIKESNNASIRKSEHIRVKSFVFFMIKYFSLYARLLRHYKKLKNTNQQLDKP